MLLPFSRMTRAVSALNSGERLGLFRFHMGLPYRTSVRLGMSTEAVQVHCRRGRGRSQLLLLSCIRAKPS
jgi:hypothetical protein